MRQQLPGRFYVLVSLGAYNSTNIILEMLCLGSESVVTAIGPWYNFSCNFFLYPNRSSNKRSAAIQARVVKCMTREV